MSAVKNVLKDNYNIMLLKDYLRDKIKEAGFSDVEIQKTPTGTRVTLHVTRPGIVIGRKGSGIRELTEKLEKDFGLKTPQIAVVEIQKPELSPSVMANRLAGHISRGTAFRRATFYVLQQIMEADAMGVEITISGKLRGDRASFEKHKQGVLPRSGYHADIIVLEDTAHVQTPMGKIGIRIRIAQKDKYIPEFELKESKKEPSKLKKKVTKEEEKGEEKEKSEVAVTTFDEEKPSEGPSTESEHIALEEERVRELETYEEDEVKMQK